MHPHFGVGLRVNAHTLALGGFFDVSREGDDGCET